MEPSGLLYEYIHSVSGRTLCRPTVSDTKLWNYEGYYQLHATGKTEFAEPWFTPKILKTKFGIRKAPHDWEIQFSRHHCWNIQEGAKITAPSYLLYLILCDNGCQRQRRDTRSQRVFLGCVVDKWSRCAAYKQTWLKIVCISIIIEWWRPNEFVKNIQIRILYAYHIASSSLSSSSLSSSSSSSSS